jgi:hypothetical protein
MPARRDMWTGRFEFPWRGWGPLEPEDLDIAKIVTQNGHINMIIRSFKIQLTFVVGYN